MTIKKKKRISSKLEDVSSVEKIQSLQEMIANAERTISSAKQMLAKLGAVPEVKESRPIASGLMGEEKIVYGTFDGQVMIGEDSKQYPVPANYASKSKLVEGDTLKLTITPEGNFVYKQVGPAERKYLIGIVQQDERGNYIVSVGGVNYRVLLAAATYFKIELGDEVTLVVPRDHSSTWAAIENVLRKASDLDKENLVAFDLESKKQEYEKFRKMEEESFLKKVKSDEDVQDDDERPSSAVERLKKEMEEERKMSSSSEDDLMKEWTPDLEELKREASHPARSDE